MSMFPKERVNLSPSEFKNILIEYDPKFKDIPAKKLQEVVSKYHQKFIEELIDDKKAIELPKNMGFIVLVSCQGSDKKNVDFYQTKKYGKPIYRTNSETRGRILKIMYSNFNKRYRFELKKCWGFRPCRTFKRAGAKNFREEFGDYFRLDRGQKISASKDFI